MRHSFAGERGRMQAPSDTNIARGDLHDTGLNLLKNIEAMSQIGEDIPIGNLP